MRVCCPYCGSPRVIQRNIGKKIGATIGTVGGAATGAANAIAGASIGGRIGALVGPTGLTVGLLYGALLGALFGATTCGIAGARVGTVIDERVLDNLQCLDCDGRFSATEAPFPQHSNPDANH